MNTLKAAAVWRPQQTDKSKFEFEHEARKPSKCSASLLGKSLLFRLGKIDIVKIHICRREGAYHCFQFVPTIQCVDDSLLFGIITAGLGIPFSIGIYIITLLGAYIQVIRAIVTNLVIHPVAYCLMTDNGNAFLLVVAEILASALILCSPKVEAPVPTISLIAKHSNLHTVGVQVI